MSFLRARTQSGCGERRKEKTEGTRDEDEGPWSAEAQRWKTVSESKRKGKENKRMRESRVFRQLGKPSRDRSREDFSRNPLPPPSPCLVLSGPRCAAFFAKEPKSFANGLRIHNNKACYQRSKLCCIIFGIHVQVIEGRGKKWNIVITIRATPRKDDDILISIQCLVVAEIRLRGVGMI